MNQDALTQIGVDSPVADEAARLASLAQANGIDGIVCSPMEARAMRELLGPDALIVTPGVRPAGAELGDVYKRQLAGKGLRWLICIQKDPRNCGSENSGSSSRTRTYNNAVNSRGLYH